MNLREFPFPDLLRRKPEHQGKQITLHEKRQQHWYEVEGVDRLLPSVTTYLKIIDKSGALTGWARNVTLDAVEEVLRDPMERENLTGTLTGEHGEDAYDRFVEYIIKAGRNASLSRKAADEGNTAHDIIAEELQGGWPEIPDAFEAAVRGAREFMRDHFLAPVAIEEMVWHPKHLYAGTIDLIAKTPRGSLVIVDWKRSRGIYPEHEYQVAAYASAVNALTGLRIRTAYVVRLPREKDDKYETKQVTDIPKAAAVSMAAFTLWNKTRGYRGTKDPKLTKPKAVKVSEAEAKAEQAAIDAAFAEHEQAGPSGETADPSGEPPDLSGEQAKKPHTGRQAGGKDRQHLGGGRGRGGHRIAGCRCG